MQDMACHQIHRRSIVLVGMMGAGKSCIGRGLAVRLGLPFRDADTEIEAAAGCTINDIFERHGEKSFREGERRVIRRLLDGEQCVLATGGGAFMDAQTRIRIQQQAISVWLRATVDLLLRRVSRRDTRPLLRNGDPWARINQLAKERNPVYAEADITVDSLGEPQEVMVDRVHDSLNAFIQGALSSA